MTVEQNAASTTTATSKARRGGKRGNGEGNIRQRPDGLWEARIALEGGKRKSLYGKTRQEVAAKLAAATRDRDRGLHITTDERQTIKSFAAGWLERMQPRLRASTHRRYGEHLAHVIAALGSVRLVKLTATQVEALYAAKLKEGQSATTVSHMHMVLKSMLKDAVRKHLIPYNVCEMVTVPRAAHHEMQVLDLQQVRQLLTAAAGDRWEALYVLAVTSGMRLGELLALKWHDVDLERGKLQVRASVRPVKGGGVVFTEPKTKHSRRTIALTRAAIESFRGHRLRQVQERLAIGPDWDDGDLVFPSSVGTPMDGRNLTQHHFYPLLKRAGLPQIRFHDLRHTCATTLLGQGINPKQVSEMLGHSAITITLGLYGHVLPHMHQQAADVMDAILAQ